MKYNFKPSGVCSREIELEIDEGIIKDIKFHGGCSGNSKGVSALARGQKAEDIIKNLKGITCGPRATSCPDQLSIAIEQALKQE